MTASRGVIGGDDYVDTDVAYLLGMLYGRGQLIEHGDVRRLVITLDIRRTLPKLPKGVETPAMDLDVQNERALNIARRRINDLLDANVDVAPVRKGETTLTAVFVKPTIAWRDLKCLCSGGTDRSNFRLPSAFLDLVRGQRALGEEFLRGFADVAVMPSAADNAWGGRIRIAFPVVNANIRFARQLVKLFELLGVAAPLLKGTPESRGGSKKEHRIRPYVEDYESIGFHFSHKQQLLKLLAKFNRGLKPNAAP